jgi:hypothetical protein
MIFVIIGVLLVWKSNDTLLSIAGMCIYAIGLGHLPMPQAVWVSIVVATCMVLAYYNR